MIRKSPLMVKLLIVAVLIIACIASAGTFFVEQASSSPANKAYALNSAAYTDYAEDYYNLSVEGSVENKPLFAANTAIDDTQNVYNVTIFIKFEDTTAEVAQKALSNSLKIYSNSDTEIESVRSYYSTMTDGGIVINNCFAYNDQDNTSYFVYTAPGDKADFQNTDKTDSEGNLTAARIAKEKSLLQGAVQAFNDAAYKLDYQGADFDIDDDGYFDSMSFVVLDQSSDDWGSLLWPHQSDGRGIGITTPIDIAQQTLKTGDYTFSFGYIPNNLQYNFAVACHEMGHVFGINDYYSYDKKGTTFTYAKLFDLMADTASSTRYPSYMTAYTRNKYLKNLTGEIKTVYKRQEITLTAATEATDEDIVAVKIPTNYSGIYYMAEYRINNSTSTYDGSIGGSGVIVYRVNENATGNTKAVNRTDYDDIELLVYNCQNGASNAFLDVTNESFGDLPVKSQVDLDVDIRLTAISGDKATIEISGPGLRDNTVEPTPDDYFLNKISVESSEYVFDVANQRFGIKTTIKVTNIDMAKLSNMSISLVDKDGVPTHTMAATRGVLLPYSGKTGSFEVFFDYLGGGALDSFSGYRLNKNQPVAVTVTVTDTDNDVLPIGTVGIDGKKQISTNNFIWENIVKIADMYDVTELIAEKPYIEVAVGDTFSLGAVRGLPNSGRKELSIEYVLPSGLEKVDDEGLLRAAEAGTYVLIFTSSFKGKALETSITVEVLDSVAADKYLMVNLADATVVELLGTPWADLKSQVVIDGATVNLKDTEGIGYSADFYNSTSMTTTKVVLFSYLGEHYKTTINVKNQLVAVNLEDGVFNLFDEQSLFDETKLTMYYKNGSTVTFAIKDLSRYGISFAYDISGFSGDTYMPIDYTVSYDGVSVMAQFNLYRVSVVEDSFVASGQNVKVVVGEGETVTYYTGSFSAGAVNMGDFKISFSINTGDGIKDCEATQNGTQYVLRGFPLLTESDTGMVADKTDITISIWYVNGDIEKNLGSLKLNFRILKAPKDIAVTSVESGKVTVFADNNNAVAFFIDEYKSGQLNFQYVLSFDIGEEQYVPFVLEDKVEICEGLFSFTSTEWGLSKTLYFYGVDVVTDITVGATSYYGEELETDYMATTFLAKSILVTPSISGFDKLGALNGVQSVVFSITYFTEDSPYNRTVEITKSIQLVDGVYELKRATLTTTSFRYGEQASIDYVEMLTYVTNYNHYNSIDEVASANIDEITFSTLNHNKLSGATRTAEDILTLTYRGKTIDVAVTLTNDIKQISLSQSSYITGGVLYIEQGTSHIYYVVTYENDETESIEIALSGAYTTTTEGGAFRGDDIGEYRVDIKNPKLPSEKLYTQSILVYKKVKSIDGIYKDGKVLSSISIEYGDVVNLVDYVVKYTGQDNVKGQITLKRNYYKLENNAYCTMSGDTAVTAFISVLSKSSSTFDAGSIVVPVKVLSKINDELIKVKDGISNISINHQKGIVMLSTETSTVDIVNMFSTEDRFRLVYPSVWAHQNAGGFVETDGKKQGYMIAVVNRDNYTVCEYQVLLSGDGNGNAKKDADDIHSFAKAYADGSIDDYINLFSDGSFSLEDLVKQILDRRNTATQSPIPLAELFVCEYKGREDEV